jgi:hypothetical protein
VPHTLASLGIAPEAVICLDSHLDTYVTTSDIEEAFPKSVRLAATRASAHTRIRWVMGGFPPVRDEYQEATAPDFYVVAPEKSLVTSVVDLGSQLSKIAGPREEPNTVDTFVSMLADAYGISLYLSPPRSLAEVKQLVRGHDVLIDLDVDYMFDMQKECYSPLGNAERGDLGQMVAVLKLIARSTRWRARRS